MRSVTGIELGPDSCVLVRAAARDGVAEISAVHVIEPDDWPQTEATLTAHLASIRTAHHLPRHARAVLWSFENGSLVHRALVLRALKAAGFAIDGFLSPPQALAGLAHVRQPSDPDSGMAWLTLNRRGAAIAVVRRGTTVFSRVLRWRTGAVEDAGRKQELARYLIVAQAAQELRHAFDVARIEHRTPIETVVTCGDYPDLRSLTMPLIEELDVEVETLDTLEGIRLVRPVDADLARERASALRLACAAALSAAPRRVDPRRVMAATAAGLVLGAAALGALWRFQEDVRPASPPESPPVVAPPIGDARSAQTPAAPEPTTGTAAADMPAERPAPDQEAPLPVVTSILIGSDRRLAIVNGRIVGVGDRVGSRVVLAIDRDSVVFRDPAGADVRVPIRRIRGM